MKIGILVLLIITVFSAVPADLMTTIPGYPRNFPTRVWSGYLSTQSPQRRLHYVFLQSISGNNNKDPVTLWLNGGPGCSSMLGFLQEIGPYYLDDPADYQVGDNLTYNPYSWHNVSNLLFLQSPAGVGFSYNLNATFQYDDVITANDNMAAVADFFSKFPQYSTNNFWISGESYAGKYIPDLAVLIDKFNIANPKSLINLKGILVGNGVMSFLNDQLEKSTVDFMINHNFVDPQILSEWDICKLNFDAVECDDFFNKFFEGTDGINPYGVYDYCFESDHNVSTNPNKKTFKSQQQVLRSHLKLNKKLQMNNLKDSGAPCSYFDGVFHYFNSSQSQYHARSAGQTWEGPCADIQYNIDETGSIDAYKYLLERKNKYQIFLYNGDWDAVVPYVDTIKHIKNLLSLKSSGIYQPWFTDRQHSGFVTNYGSIHFATFKGASHQVPQGRRAEALNYLSQVLGGIKNVEKIEKRRSNLKEQ